VAIVFGFTACSDGNDNGGGGDDKTPVATDYTFGNMSQTAASVTAVTITAKSGKMAYSDNGETWTATDSTFGNIRVSYVAYGGSAGSKKWVAVGYSGKMAYSNNGVSWTAGTDNTFGTTNIMALYTFDKTSFLILPILLMAMLASNV
jgi:hypothetical protein